MSCEKCLEADLFGTDEKTVFVPYLLTNTCPDGRSHLVWHREQRACHECVDRLPKARTVRLPD